MTKLLFAFIILISACQSKYKFYYYELGKLDCEVAKVLEKGMIHLRNNPDDSIGIDSLLRLYDTKIDTYQIFTEKYWELEKYIKLEFTEGEAINEYLRGYDECNCDTCLFFKESLDEPRKKKVVYLKQI